MDAKEIKNSSLDDMVFEYRNKNYGSYILRKIYGKNLTISSAVASALFVLFVTSPYIFAFAKEVKKEKKKDYSEVELAEAPSQEKEPPPPPPAPPPPIRAMIQFVPPVVAPDEQVHTPPVDPDDLPKNVDLGNQNIAGDSTGDFRGLPDVAAGPISAGEEKPLTYVEQMPVYPGGEEELTKFLQKNIVYPTMAMENDIQGKVMVEFTVGKDGRIRDAKVIKGIGFGCDQEALRVINKMPAWNPGKQNGREVPVIYHVPVKFTLH